MGMVAHLVAERQQGSSCRPRRWLEWPCGGRGMCARAARGAAARTGLPSVQADRGSSALPSVPVAPSLAGVVKPPSEGAYLGIYQPPAPFHISALDELEIYPTSHRRS